MIKVRLYSVTFGKVVTKYYNLPDTIFECSDNELFDNVVNYLLAVSGYDAHINEKFDFYTK